MKKLKLILCLALGCFLLIGGGGTAQAASKRPEMDKAKAIATLQVGFDYSEAELGKYLDEGMTKYQLGDMQAASVLFEKLIDSGYKNAYFIVTKDYEFFDRIPEKYLSNIIYKYNRLLCRF